MTTEQQFLTDHNAALKADLASALDTIAVLRRQLEQAGVEQEKLAFRCDFLTKEIARVTASREQYERVAIRLSAKMEGALQAVAHTFTDMQQEIRDAAFTKVPGTCPKELPPDVDGAAGMAAKLAPTPLPQNQLEEPANA